MGQVVIRCAREADYSEVCRIMNQVQEMHVAWRPDIYRHAEVLLPYEGYLESVKSGTFLVAERDGQVVGVLFYMVRHIESCSQVTRNILFIDSIAVDDRYRGQGIGHQLLDHVAALREEKQYDGVELQVNAKNAAARQMYARYGFTEKSINLELPACAPACAPGTTEA